MWLGLMIYILEYENNLGQSVALVNGSRSKQTENCGVPEYNIINSDKRIQLYQCIVYNFLQLPQLLFD